MQDRDTNDNRPHPANDGSRPWRPFDFGPDQTRPYAGFDENWARDRQQLPRALGRALYWTFTPHTKNSATRKIVTSVLMFTWAVITIGEAFGFAQTGEMYPYISLLVFAIVSTIYGFELGALDTVAKTTIRNDDEDD